MGHTTPVDPTRRQLYRILGPVRDLAGELGLWMGVLEEARRETLDAVEGLTPDQLAWKPPSGGNSIGQLLRHVAAVELEWIQNDLLGRTDLPPDRPPMLRNDDAMSNPGPLPLSDFAAVLSWVRAHTRKALEGYPAEEIDATRTYQDPGVRKVFNVRWILHHIADHEAQHRGQMLAVKRMMKAGR